MSSWEPQARKSLKEPSNVMTGIHTRKRKNIKGRKHTALPKPACWPRGDLYLRSEAMVEEGFLCVHKSSVLPIQVLNTPLEKNKVAQYMWTLEHLLFGSMPLQNLGEKKLGWSMNIIPGCWYFSIAGTGQQNQSSSVPAMFFVFFLNLNPIYSKLKCNGKHILQLVTGLMLCVRSHVRCWRLGSQGPESLPSLTSRLVARGVAQWYSICLACAKPWVQFPALGGIKEFSKSFWKLFFLGSTGD